MSDPLSPRYARLLVCVLILGLALYYYQRFSIELDRIEVHVFHLEETQEQKRYPFMAYQTYHDLSLIPPKVEANWKKFAPEYTRVIYDDKMAEQFLEKYYSPNVLAKFRSMDKGAHKADLFRYCLLYIQGGLYADIKTEWITPVKDLFREHECMYLVESMVKERHMMTNESVCYNGVLFTPPRNPLFLMLIKHAVATHNWAIRKEYLIFCHYLYELASRFTSTGDLVPGKNLTDSVIPDIVYWQETDFSLDVCQGPDRYGLCSLIVDEYRQPIIKTRYNDYPWTR